MSDLLTRPLRTTSICRASARLCARLGWAPVMELSLPSWRRLDIMALRPGGCLIAIEVKSCAADFLTDGKWQEYRDWCDALYFAVDCDFPQELLPDEIGLIVTEGPDAVMVRKAPEHRLAPARRKSLLQRFAVVAAGRLAALADPAGAAELRASLAVE